MKLVDILTSEARQEIRDLRVDAYLDEADSFLGFAYDDDPMLVAPETRRALAAACLERSRVMGTVHQREHLAYLAASVVCGYAFEANPLFAFQLERAGWLNAEGALRRAPDPEPMVIFASQWQMLAAAECADAMAPLIACHEAVRRAEILDPRDEGISDLALRRLLCEVWPDRTAVVPDDCLDEFCTLLQRNIHHQRMHADVAIMFSVLSLHLGIYFFHDPRYRDLSVAFANSGAQPAERSALVAAAIARFIAPEPVMNEGRHG